MATNPPKGSGRRGAVRGRQQFFNPRNQTWFKVDRATGRIMDGKADGTPFKGVTKK